MLLLLPLLPMLPLLQLLVLLRGRVVPIGGLTPTAMGLKGGARRRPQGGGRKLLARRQRHSWSAQPWHQR